MAKRTTNSTVKPAASPQAAAASVEGEQIVPAVITEISGGLPSTDTGPETAKPESKPVEGDASSSSAEASIATTPATETGQVTGQGETGALPVTDSSIGQQPTPAAPDVSQPETGDLQGIVRITSKIEGFRRGGMRHSKTPTDHPFDAFTSDQLDQLDDEPNLKVGYL